MSRNGSGTYNLPAGNPVVTATTITSNWANTTLNDIATALTNSLAADGQTAATGNLNLNTNRIINVVNPSSAQDAATKSYVDAKTDGTASGAFTNLTASGTFGVGTTTPIGKFNVKPNTDQNLSVTNGTAYGATDGVSIFSVNDANSAFKDISIASKTLLLNGAGGTGNVLIGTTAGFISGGNGLSIKATTGSSVGVLQTLNFGAPTYAWTTGPDGTGNYVVLNNTSTGVYMVYGATSWTGISDERLKTDLKPIENAVDKVNGLRSVTGRFKTDEEGKSRSFLIAQDVLKEFPEAAETSNPEKLGVQYTDVIPLLVAAIKELNAKVITLEAKLQAK
jgi:hypothetical protein